MSPVRRPSFRLLLAPLVLAACLAAWAWDHLRPEHSPMERGIAAARELECWSCHQAAARGEPEAAAPSMFGGSRSPEVIRRVIRDSASHASDVSDGQQVDLAAWIAIVQLEIDRAGDPDAARSEVGAAERIARRNCFSCHGDLGQGGVKNVGSLKGYVPGFFGSDYDQLTRDGRPDVLREWIRDGLPGFFRIGVGALRPGLWFTEHQQVKMPGYQQILRREEIETLVRYLALLRSLGPLDADAVRQYRELRRLPVEQGWREGSRQP